MVTDVFTSDFGSSERIVGVVRGFLQHQHLYFKNSFSFKL